MRTYQYSFFLDQHPPFSDRISFAYTGSAFIITDADNFETFTRDHNEGLSEVKRVRALILPVFLSNPTRSITRISLYTTLLKARKPDRRVKMGVPDMKGKLKKMNPLRTHREDPILIVNVRVVLDPKLRG